jgi:hypothetical protein
MQIELEADELAHGRAGEVRLGVGEDGADLDGSIQFLARAAAALMPASLPPMISR